MKKLDRTIGFLFLVTLCMFYSCKKVAKEVVEESTETVISKTAAKGISEEGFEKLSKKELKVIEWSDLYKAISKKSPSLGKAIERLDGKVQKAIAVFVKNDYKFFRGLTSSYSVLDECEVYAKNAPQLMKDPNFIRMYVKLNIAKCEGKQCLINDLIAKSEGGFVKFYDRSTNKLFAEYRDGVMKTFDKSLLYQELIPNTCYAIDKGMGKKCSFFVDDLGRISSVDAKRMSPDEIVTEIINKTGNTDFGADWNKALKRLKQTSKMNDVDVKCKFNYSNDAEITPKYAHVDANINGKKQISSTYQNTAKRIGNTFSASENSSILKKYASKLGLSQQKCVNLLSEMDADDELAKLIHSNPEFNIKRWANTRNHVDKKLLKKFPNGRYAQNAKVYAGNIYYFNPHLNSGLKARLKRGNGVVTLKNQPQLSYDNLVELDRLYPDGVPFTKEGFPDFTNIAAKNKKGQPIKINIGKLSGDTKTDTNLAETMYQKQGNKYEKGYTWHHVENSTYLLRVPMKLHQLIDHSGGMSTSAAKQIVKQAA